MNVPVLMYHSVGFPDKDWIHSHLTSSLSEFENQIKTFKRAGFTTITLLDLYKYRTQNKQIPKKSIVLTFDDSYLDNWIYVYPVLKRYGLKGTIFVSPEFVDPSKEARPNLFSIKNKSLKEKSKLMKLGFINWNEMWIMEEEGVMDIQSHTMTHTFYPVFPKVIDYRKPSSFGKFDKYVWMDWNKYPDKKYDYFNTNFPDSSGEPVYEFKEAIIARKFFPDSSKYETKDEHGKIFKNENIYNLFLKLSKEKVDLYIGVSEATKQMLIKNARIDHEKIKVLYNFVDLEKFNPESLEKYNRDIEREKLGINKTDFVIGFVGRLSKVKGCEYLIKSIPYMDISNFKVLIAGDGLEREKLEKLVKNLNIKDKIIFLGYVKDILSFYRMIDVLVFPSKFESFGISVIESQSCCVPVVASNVGALNEIIKDNENGLLFEFANEKDLAEKIRFIEKDKEFGARLIKNGVCSVKKYSLENYLNALNLIYNYIKMPRILITGCNCSINKGSAAMLISTVTAIKKFIPNAKFVMLSKFPENDYKECRKYGIKMVDYKALRSINPLRMLFCLFRCMIWSILIKYLNFNIAILIKGKVLQEYKKCDILIDLSGDGLNHGFVWSIISFGGILLAIIMGKPALIYPQSIGPFTPLSKYLARFALNKVNFITAREEITKNYLKKMGIDRVPVYLVIQFVQNIKNLFTSDNYYRTFLF
ncbi:hypothetical protein BEH94_03710 [Candidatus Altiarchaeales archaeon WOR_SM1_SCG]|nr:hypothetical protein BEH94_03710 [Candidatus Altiarchaeales archaeon WOR_SM1_SCG]